MLMTKHTAYEICDPASTSIIKQRSTMDLSFPKLSALQSSGCLLTALFIISLCGCSSQTNSFSNRYFPVNNNNKRESSFGFSITPPAGAGWLEKLNKDSLYYLKKMNTKDYSIYTKATEIHIPDTDLEAEKFLQFVKETRKIPAKSNSYRNISTTYTVNPELSPLCVRYLQKYEDHGNKNLKVNDFIKIRKSGLVCMHPDTLSDGVDMFYMESFLQSEASGNTSFKEEGESFLSSLKFHAPVKKRG